MIQQEDTNALPPEWVDVEAHVREHPEDALLVRDLLDKLQVARDRQWVGKLEVNIVTGEVRGKIVVKAA